MTRDEIIAEITKHFPLEEFLQIHDRLAVLRKEEADKLKALAELQATYVSSITDRERENVKTIVGQIRELSRKTREEIRALNVRIHGKMELADAKELYERYLAAPHSPK
jgi:hypothetical protein